MEQKQPIPGTPASLQAGEFITIQDIFDAIRRWKWIIVAMTVISGVASAVYYFQQPDIYSATAKLLYGNQQKEVSLFGNGFSSKNSRAMANELEILKSRQFAELIVRAMSDSLTTNPSLSRYSLFSSIRETGNYNYAIAQIMARRAASSQRAVDILTISFTSEDPEEAAIVTNLISNVYIYNDINNNRNIESIVKEFIRIQLEEKEKELKETENELQRYMVESGIITVASESQDIIKNISELEARINESLLQIGILEEQTKLNNETLSKFADESGLTVPVMLTDQYIMVLQTRIAALESDRDIKKVTQNSNDYAVRVQLEELDSQAKSLRQLLEKRINESLLSQIPSNTLEKVKSLQNSILVAGVSIQIEKYKIDKLNVLLREYEGKFKGMPQKNVEYARRERSRRTAEELYLILQKKYQEAVISELQISTSIKILDYALPNYFPVEPERSKMIITFTLIGLFGGIGIAIGLKKLDNRIHKLEDLEKLNVNILGQVPAEPETVKTGNIIKDSTAITQEMHRQISINVNYILNRKSNTSGIVLATTSTIPQEGKTFTGILLAASLADLGYKVLLMDGDLRRPTVDKNLPVKRFPGLNELILNNDFSGIQRINSFHESTFDVLGAGTLPVSPVPLISSEKFQLVIDDLRKKYNYIIIDTPPSLSVGDVYVYGEQADGIIYVCGAEVVQKQEFLRQYRNLINRFGSKVTGVILNKVRRENLSGQGNYHYYYYARTES